MASASSTCLKPRKEGVMISCVVEMYGLSREISGLSEVKLELEDNARLGDVVSELKHKLPEMEGPVIRQGLNRLEDTCVFNINGIFYHNEDNLKIEDGEHIRLLSVATGG